MTVGQPSFLLPFDESSGTTITNHGTVSGNYTIQNSTESTHWSWVTNSNSTLSYLDVFTTAVFVYATTGATAPSSTLEAIKCAFKFSLESLAGGTRTLWQTSGTQVAVYATSPSGDGQFDLHLEVTSNFSTTVQYVFLGLTFGTAYRVAWCYDPSTPTLAKIRAKLDSATVVNSSTVDHDGHSFSDTSWPTLLASSGGYAPTKWYYVVYQKGGTAWSDQDLTDINTDPVSTITGWPTSGPVPLPGTLSFGGQSPSVTQQLQRAPAVGTLTITGQQAQISVPGAVVPSVAALALSGVAAVVTQQIYRVPGVGALVLTGNQPSLSSNGNTGRTPTVGALTLTGDTVVQELGTPSPVTGTLTLTGNQPGMQLAIVRSPSTGQLSLAGVQAQVSGQLVISPATIGLSLTGNQPTVQLTFSDPLPQTANLQIVGYQPTLRIEVVSPLTKTPSTGALTLSGQLVNRVNGLPSGYYPTAFISDATPMPAGAMYIGGAAFAQSGERYVTYWPSNNRVVFLGGLAHREDGALIIDPAGVIAGHIQGLGLTYRGELVTTLLPRELDHNGFPLLQSGKVSVTNQS